MSLAGQPFAWRFRYEEFALSPFVPKEYADVVTGVQTGAPAELGDFVVYKADGTPAYQLAVVVDDHAMGINEVIRGDDLIPSTFRQLALNAAFGWTPPRFGHVPLVIGADGRRLAKRHGDTRLSRLREEGVSADQLVGYLAWTCGLQEQTVPRRPHELLSAFHWNLVPRTPLVFNDQSRRQLAEG
jgi:glutamyl-tRNA synthetase